jgi:hypothetical protein
MRTASDDVQAAEHPAVADANEITFTALALT